MCDNCNIFLILTIILINDLLNTSYVLHIVSGAIFIHHLIYLTHNLQLRKLRLREAVTCSVSQLLYFKLP